MTIKELSVNYDPVNENNTFTSGDILQGRVFLEVSKEVKIDSLFIKCKGDADVHWTERHHDRDHHYHAHERYFKLKQYFIQDPTKKGKEGIGVIVISGESYSNMVRPGRHVFPFSFQLPHGNLPPSFKGCYGSVKYILEARLDRSWKLDRTATKEITFVPRVVGVNAPLNNPQNGATDKKMKLFTSGSASLKATIDKMGYAQGEVIKVSTSVDNSSSRDLKLKYSLEQKQFFFAQNRSKHSSKVIFKVVGDPVPVGSKLTFNTNLTIPPNVELSMANCGIIKVDYIFKVYLDIPYASDPEIKFPVIILPAGQICTPWQGQPVLQPYGNPGQPGWGNPPSQPGFGPSPPGAAFGPAPGLYPSPYPPPANPEAPPPSYADLYPNPNSAAPGFHPGPSAPASGPPQYPAMGYPNVPQQHPAPTAPEFSQNPPPQAYGPAGNVQGFWPNPTNAASQPDPYPTKTA